MLTEMMDYCIILFISIRSYALLSVIFIPTHIIIHRFKGLNGLRRNGGGRKKGAAIQNEIKKS